MTKVYFAAPLFSMAERVFNRRLAESLRAAAPDLDILLPQDFKPHGSFNDNRHYGLLYKGCIESLTRANAVVAILDGPDGDSGTCFEVGFAVAKNKPVVGVRTDYRASQESGTNLMLSRGCNVLINRPSFDEDFDSLAKEIVRKLKKILK